jgi:hypothetical protein
VLCYSGLCVAFVGGGLSVFSEINFYIALLSAVERVFCGYMKSAVLSQPCAVMIFGDGVYCVLLHERQRVTVNCISHQIEGKYAPISLNIVLDISRY